YRWIAALAALLQLMIAGWLYASFNTATVGLQFTERYNWITAYHIQYFLGVDGISISMVLLTAIICFVSVFASFSIERGEKGYYALLMLLDTGMMGVFVALDFFLFYIFWEVMLLPMYFLIGVWGGPRREYAAIKFFLYTLLGSVLILLAMLALYYYGATPTFDMMVLAANASHYSIKFQRIVWIALFIGFAIKIPAFPFHTWLPDAHVEAPTAISVILAGVLLKMGAYGILRVNYPILPAASHELAWLFLGLVGVINIVYGALCAMAQTDYKKLIAYSSISHMGYVMLGMASFTAIGINGAVLQMFNHGTITAMLFILVGVIYDRAHHREIDGFGGLAQRMPMYAGVTGFAFFAAMGLPGLSAFISEVMVLLGSWRPHPIFTMLAALTAILTAGYLLWCFQRIYLGPLNEKYKLLPDLGLREAFTLVPLGAIVLLLGVYPHAVLMLLHSSLNHLNRVVIASNPAVIALH
ncbi:MAG: complex I subunit 4 family protein, partial [Candidatus Binataceae bacterium]